MIAMVMAGVPPGQAFLDLKAEAIALFMLFVLLSTFVWALSVSRIARTVTVACVFVVALYASANRMVAFSPNLPTIPVAPRSLPEPLKPIPPPSIYEDCYVWWPLCEILR